MVEVWSGSEWVSVDPTELGLVGSARPSSAAEIKRMSGSLRVFEEDGSVRQNPYVLSESIANGEIVYPEPWLYTRAGHRFSFWPFRGEFVQVGMYGWRFSTPLLLCRVAFLISVFIWLSLIAKFLFGSDRMVAVGRRFKPNPAVQSLQPRTRRAG